MKKADVKIGETYVVKVSGALVPVRILGPCSYGGWTGKSERTGREVRVRSAGRLRRPWRHTVDQNFWRVPTVS